MKEFIVTEHCYYQVNASHAGAITPAGGAFCWGQNSYGEAGAAPAGGCGVHDCVRSPTAVGGGHEFTTISAGEYLTCAVTPGGAGYCWGRGGEGQLGAGAIDDSAIPVRVASPPGNAGA